MDALAESFPMMLYRRFRDGETVMQLAVEFDIAEDRVEARLRAAALYDERRRIEAGLTALRANVA
ncbi:MAG TPA: hypothetical protein VN893_23735 [Bryobacteraceae bacterium]|nr:hypothetical protein [Bryobacteraceae bacterium]